MAKKTRCAPDPAPVAREAIQWLLYTLNLEMTRKSHMTVDVTRSVLVKLDTLNASIHDLLMANLNLKSKLEESRYTVDKCVKAVAAQFAVDLKIRELAYDRKLEAVVARYDEKEATRTIELEKNVPPVAQNTPGESFAKVARAPRPEKTIAERKADR